MADWLNPNEWGRAFCRHFCFATFQDELAREIERQTKVYRQQVADLQNYLKETEENLKKISELNIEKMQKEHEASLKTTEEQVKTWRGIATEIHRNLYDACIPIAIRANFDPLEWELLKDGHRPFVRKLVEEIKAKLPPPTPPPPTLGLGLTLPRIKDIIEKK
ncbi:MAG: hypothetical protein IH857_01570 [Deltaproteobacteria bacterium]|nr:hypothetical protein [Deltaproteobacteria bacterium]